MVKDDLEQDSSIWSPPAAAAFNTTTYTVIIGLDMIWVASRKLHKNIDFAGYSTFARRLTMT